MAKKALIRPSITFPISYFGWRKKKKKWSMHARKKKTEWFRPEQNCISILFGLSITLLKRPLFYSRLKFSNKADIDHSKRLYIFWKWKGIEWETNFCTMKYGPQKLSNIGLYSYYILDGHIERKLDTWSFERGKKNRKKYGDVSNETTSFS